MLKITIEGPQGSGETTAADLIAEALDKAGYLVESRSEEGGKDMLSVARRTGSFARAFDYVAGMRPAISGDDGHGVTFAVAQKLVQDFALSDFEALAVLKEYSKRCEPPWSDKELRHKINQARVSEDTHRRGHPLEDPWAPAIAKWLKEHGVGDKGVFLHEVIRGAICKESDFIARSDEARVATILRGLGYESRHIGYVRVSNTGTKTADTETTYKFRAEFWRDVYKLLEYIFVDRVEIKLRGSGICWSDIEVTIERPRRNENDKGVMSLADLAELIRSEVVYSHVIVETLRLASEYTGERT